MKWHQTGILLAILVSLAVAANIDVSRELCRPKDNSKLTPYTIQGHILDSEGKAVPYAKIHVENSNTCRGLVGSDENGFYQFTIYTVSGKPSVRLLVSKTGLQSESAETIPQSPTSQLDVQLSHHRVIRSVQYYGQQYPDYKRTWGDSGMDWLKRSGGHDDYDMEKRLWGGANVDWLKRSSEPEKRVWGDSNMNWLKRKNWEEADTKWLKKRAWNNANTDWLKRAWGDAGMEWLKRSYDPNQSWLKRTWEDNPHVMKWLKRAWGDANMEWMKRDDDEYEDKDKRTWSSANTDWLRKRDYPSHRIVRREAEAVEKSDAIVAEKDIKKKKVPTATLR